MIAIMFAGSTVTPSATSLAPKVEDSLQIEIKKTAPDKLDAELLLQYQESFKGKVCWF